MRGIEPLRVAHFDRQLGLRRPGIEETAQICDHPRGIARRELEEHGTQAAAELLHYLQEFQGLGDVLAHRAGVADRFRDFGAELEIGGRLFHPAGDRVGGWDGVKRGVAFHRVQPPGILPQEIGRLGPFREKVADPPLKCPNWATQEKAHIGI